MSTHEHKSRLHHNKPATHAQRKPLGPSKDGELLPQHSVPGAIQRAPSMVNPAQARPASILALQRAAGNRAVSGLIQAQAANSGKLTVGPVGDRYEREADRVADQVLDPRRDIQRQVEEEEVQTKPLAASITPIIQRQVEEEELQTKPILRRRVGADGSFEAGASLEERLAAERGRGSPLADNVRANMESRFGTDFGDVRIHTGGAAVQMSQELQAQAFTHGQDIYMGQGHYDPQSERGKHLLAHELTHTIQQGSNERIQGWWPKGHRLVTELALKEGKFAKTYDKKARQFLIDRSPDIDFIQDEFDTMNEGIQQAGPVLERYQNLIQSGQEQAAQRMYWSNELHKRRPAYAMSHGEAGLYKESNASAKNEAMTSRLVDKAAALWDWNNGTSWGQSLSVLSDALHQAADRGSHGEGNSLTGHDVRIVLNTQPWEKRGQQIFKGKSGGVEPADWEPDNMSVNTTGAILAVGFVQGALAKFKNAVQAKQTNRQKEPQIKLSTRVPGKRSLRVLKGQQALVGTSGFGSHFAGQTGGGLKSLKKILKTGKQNRRLKQLYEDAKASPQVRQTLDQGFTTGLLTEGVNFYEVGARLFSGQERTLFNKQFKLASNLFQKWQQSKAQEVIDYPEIKRRYKIRFRTATEQYEGREKEIVASAFRAAYHAVYKRPPWDPFD